MRFSIRYSILSQVFGLASAICLALFGFNMTAIASDLAHQRILATFPHGAYHENLEVLPDERMLFTDYLNKKIEVMHTDENVTTFAKLNDYPLSLLAVESGYIVVASGMHFLEGPDFVKTQKIVLLDKNGNEVDQFATPNALVLNGIMSLPNGTVLVADSMAATIWRVDVEARKITPWVQDPALAQIPDQPVFLPGANGLKLRGDGVIVSNTSHGNLLEIKFDTDGNPVGKPKQIAETGRIDDIWIRQNGAILYTTHSDELMQVETDGTITELFAHGCNGCTAIAPYPLGQDQDFVFVGDGGMYEGHKDPATVVLVTLKK